MSGLISTFAAAPRLKLRINGNVVAFAVGFNINISVEVQPVYVIGSYKAVSLEPTMYNVVTGSLQIVRLTSSNTKDALIANSIKDKLSGGTAVATQQSLSDAAGNELIAPTTAGASATNNPLQAELFKHIDPAQLIVSRSFDVDVYMKVPDGSKFKETTGFKATDLKEVAWMHIMDCRITSRNTNISMGQIVNEPLTFQGLIATHAFTDTTKEFKLDGKVQQT